MAKYKRPDYLIEETIKSANPASKNSPLIRRALPGSYADYLTADRNNYAAAQQFDQIIANNEKIQNSPTPIVTETITNAPTPTAVQRTYAAPIKMPAADTVVSGDQTEAASPNLIPIKSYTEWLEAGGMTGMAQKQYDAAVRAAETDYAKSKALYGQNAETLGRAGLTGSGYGDYLTGAGFAAMQGAKVAAADTRALTEAQQRSDYANYLMTVDAQNREIEAQFKQEQAAAEAQANAEAADALAKVDQLMLGGYTDDAIRAYIGQHYGDKFTSYVDGWLSNAHTYNDATLAQNTATNANAATAGYRSEIFKQLLSGVDPAIVRSNMEYSMMLAGEDTSQLDAWMAEAQAAAQPTLTKQQEEQAKVDADKAAAETEANKQIALERKQAAIAAYEQYASEQGGEYAKGMMQALGYTEAEIADAAATVQALASAAQNTVIDLKGLTVDQIPTADAIDNEVTLGRMSAEAGAALKQDAAARRAQIFKESLEALADPKTDTATASAEAIKLFDQIDALGAEDLTDEARAELYALRAEAYLNTAVEGNEPVSEVLKAFVDLGLDDDNANEAARKGFLNGMSKAIKVIDVNPGKLESSAVGAAIGTAVSFINPGMAGVGAQIGAAVGSDYTITVTAGEKNNGKDAKESIGVRTTKADDKEATALGDGSDKEIKALNGKLYIYDGKWKRVTRVTNASVGGKDNAKLMYDILLDYYS